MLLKLTNKFRSLQGGQDEYMSQCPHFSFVCHAYLKYILFSQVPSELFAGCRSPAALASSAFLGRASPAQPLLGGEQPPLCDLGQAASRSCQNSVLLPAGLPCWEPSSDQTVNHSEP